MVFQPLPFYYVEIAQAGAGLWGRQLGHQHGLVAGVPCVQCGSTNKDMWNWAQPWVESNHLGHITA